MIGPVPALRRRWLRRLGWYPGDWIWLSLPALAIAAAGAAIAIEVGGYENGRVAAATTVVAAAPRTIAPAPAPARPNGRVEWPPGFDGWTVVLVSVPASRGPRTPLAIAARAARDGLPQVGVLVSSAYASLHPGYDVVFSGVYSGPGDAETALQTVRARGFGGAYPRQISP